VSIAGLDNTGVAYMPTFPVVIEEILDASESKEEADQKSEAFCASTDN
jgi:hypothetical protein